MRCSMAKQWEPSQELLDFTLKGLREGKSTDYMAGELAGRDRIRDGRYKNIENEYPRLIYLQGKQFADGCRDTIQAFLQLQRIGEAALL